MHKPNKIIAVIEIDSTDLDYAEQFMQDLFWAGQQAGVVEQDYQFYLMEGTESTGEQLH